MGSRFVLADQRPLLVLEVDFSLCGETVILLPVLDALDGLLVVCQHIVQRPP